MRDRNITWLSPICALIGNQTNNLLVMGQSFNQLSQAILRALNAGTLGEDINRIFSSFMLMHQNEIDSPHLILGCGWHKWH